MKNIIERKIIKNVHNNVAMVIAHKSTIRKIFRYRKGFNI